MQKIPVEGGFVGSVIVNDAGMGTPLIQINGGPGGTFLDKHHAITTLADERPVVLYDQLGCYRSPAPFTMSMTPMVRFVKELECVLDYYGFDKVILLGHSFGGSIAADFALTYPDRVAGLILSSPLLSTQRWLDDSNTLLKDMPARERGIIERQLLGEDVPEEEYEAAEKMFYARHLCRLDPWPSRLIENFSKGNKALYTHMWGRSEFTCTGTLKDYDRFPDLKNLRMPVLLTCGRYDEARPETMEDAAKNIADAQIVVFEKSSHAPIYEEKDLYLSTMRDFVARIDSGR